jgi:hypothetical protein
MGPLTMRKNAIWAKAALIFAYSTFLLINLIAQSLDTGTTIKEKEHLNNNLFIFSRLL